MRRTKQAPRTGATTVLVETRDVERVTYNGDDLVLDFSREWDQAEERCEVELFLLVS